MDELEIMRRQLDEMKLQLDSQHIINQNLMRRVMRGKASWLNIFVTGEIIMLPFIYIIFAGVSALYGISQWIAFSFLVLAAADTAVDWRTVRIPQHMFSSASLLDFRKFLLKQKRIRNIQTCISAPLTVLWLIVFFSAIVAKTDVTVCGNIIEASKAGGIAGGVIGGIAGIIFVIIILRKIQRTNDALLRDIQDLENCEP